MLLVKNFLSIANSPNNSYLHPSMKRRLIILITLCSLFNKIWAQSPSAAIDSLVKFKVITSKERPALEKELKEKSHASYQVKVLGALEMIMLQKEFHVDPHKVGLFYGYSKDYSKNRSQDSINTSLRVLLDNIKKAGLLTDRVYAYTLKDIDSGRYFAKMQLIGSLAEMTSRLKLLAPAKLLPVAEALHKNGVVSDTAFQRLEDDIRNYKIESSFQLNGYCKLDKTFDMTKYPDDPDVWLEQLHRDIASMLPGLNFTDFSYVTIPDTSYSLPGVRFKVSLTCNGQVYKYASLPITILKKGQGKIRPKDIYIEDFYRIFNKVLTDERSSFRLHNIMFSAGKGGDGLHNFAFIALNDEQGEVFMKNPCMSYMMTSMDNYDETLTSGRIDSAIAGWRTMGLFAHLSNAEISKAIDATEAGTIVSMNELLRNFPGVVYSLDSAVMDQPPLYSALLSHLARITHGAFYPTEITQRKVKGGVKLQYLSKGKIHSFAFNTENGWMDKKFPKFMKSLCGENDLPGDFYSLPYWGEVIYLTKQQYDYAVEHKVLNFESSK
jgi:hypothetical protein